MSEDRCADVWRVLEAVHDPEIPVLSIVDLGVVRHVRWPVGGSLHVGLTPTYVGCPATEVIRGLVHRALDRAGYEQAVLEEILSPPWTSDWVTERGRRKLTAFGIAPPSAVDHGPKGLFGSLPVACPRCASEATERLSEFGSTPCKAHYRCTQCREPFDSFKCI